MEQPRVIYDALAGRIDYKDKRVVLTELDGISIPKKMHIVACGTSYHAGFWGKYLFERLAKIPVEVDIASEFRYRDPLIDKDDLVVVISQSGETADTLAGLRMVKKNGNQGSWHMQCCWFISGKGIRSGVIYPGRSRD